MQTMDVRASTEGDENVVRDATLAELIPLAEARDVSRAGGKAATLAQLMGAAHATGDGVVVPDGFVVPTSVCTRLDGEVPLALREAIASALERLGGGTVAVRSSAVAEDGDHASFAGQLVSILGCRTVDDVCEALLRCASSASTARVGSYLGSVAHGADLTMAVRVQRMVAADRAGVAFGVNPATGDDEVVINAVEGLGDALMDGRMSGEAWTVVGERARGPADAHVLDEGLARRVADLCRALGRHLGSPQDVEWAFAGTELFLLQSRPVTAAPLRPTFDDPTRGVWTRDNVHYPEAMTAFGGSTYLPTLVRALSALAEEAGLMFDGVEQRWRGGDVYGCVTPPGGKDGPPPPWWVLALLSRVIPAIRRKNRAARALLEPGKLERLADDWDRTYRAEHEAEIRRLAAVDLSSLEDEALLAHLDEALALLDRGQRLHFRLIMPWLMPTYRFVQTAAELCGWDDHAALSALAGHSQTSSAPGREAAALAERAASLGATAALTESDDPVEALRAIDETLSRDVAGWLERWGLRASGYDTGCPTLSERPGLLLGLLRSEAAADPHPAESAHVLAALDDLADRPADRTRFERALADARRVFAVREDNVLYTDNLPCGLTRRAALQIGRRLVERGDLERADHAVELHHDELQSALRGHHRDSRELAHRRARERAWVAAHPGPAVLHGEPTPPPDLRGLPAPLRTVNEAFLWVLAREYPEMTGNERKPPDDPTTLEGLGAWPGRYTGPVRVVRHLGDLEHVRRGDVLVATITVPAWSVVFPRIGALVTDRGGVLSHAAIVAREHGIPTVLDTAVATQRLSNGDLVTVDGTRGTVLRVSSAGGASEPGPEPAS